MIPLHNAEKGRKLTFTMQKLPIDSKIPHCAYWKKKEGGQNNVSITT